MNIVDYDFRNLYAKTLDEIRASHQITLIMFFLTEADGLIVFRKNQIILENPWCNAAPIIIIMVRSHLEFSGTVLGESLMCNRLLWLLIGIIFANTNTCLFLCALEKFRKTNINFVVPVRVSVRMEQLGSHWKDFHEIWYLNIFRKYVEKIQVLLKGNKNTEHFAWILI